MSYNHPKDSRRSQTPREEDYSDFYEDQEYLQRNHAKEATKLKKLIPTRDDYSSTYPAQSKTHYCDFAHAPRLPSRATASTEKTVTFRPSTAPSSDKKLKGNPDFSVKNVGTSSKVIQQLLEEKYKLQEKSERPERKSKYHLDPIPIMETETTEYDDSDELTDQSVYEESKDVVTSDDQSTYKQHVNLHDDIVQLQLSKTLIGNMVDEKIRAIKQTESQMIQQEAMKVEKNSGSGDNGIRMHRVDSHIKKIQGLKADSIMKMEQELKRLKKLDNISDSYLKYLE